MGIRDFMDVNCFHLEIELYDRTNIGCAKILFGAQQIFRFELPLSIYGNGFLIKTNHYHPESKLIAQPPCCHISCSL